MKSLAFLSFLLLLSATSWSQNEQLNYKYAFKVYNLSTWNKNTITQQFNSTNTQRFETTTNSLNLLNPTIAFQWKTSNNNFHEVELTSVKLFRENRTSYYINDSNNTRESLFGINTTTHSLMLRYEYSFNFKKSSNSRFVPSLGIGGVPYYDIAIFTPTNSNTFKTTISNFGVRAFVTPRLTYFISSKLFLDLNIPICLFDAQYRINKVNNPALTQSQQTSSQFDFYSLPKYLSARIGIGLKL